MLNYGVYVCRDKIVDYAQLDQTMSNFTLDLEQMWIKLEIPHMKIIWIGIGYPPPSGGVKEAIVQLDNNIKIATDTQRNIEMLIMGDFNIDYKKTTSADFKLLKDLERKFLLSQLIKSPTRITNKVKSTIDLIFTDINYVQDSGVLPLTISDHLPIYIIRKKEKNIKTSKTSAAAPIRIMIYAFFRL